MFLRRQHPRVVIAGKSLTCDPADSSAPIQPGNFDGYTAQQIARGMLQPHSVGLKVINPPPGFEKPFPFFALNPGETAMSMIGQAMVMRGAFMWDDADGNLCVGQHDPSAAPVAQLQEGRNILRMVSKVSDQNAVNLYSTYGQQPGVGDDYATRNAQAQVTDPSVRPNRIWVAHMWHPGDSQDAASQAGLLAARNGWQSMDLEVTVQGWIRPDGKLWNITDNTSVLSPLAIPNGTGYMVLGTQGVTYSLASNDQGEGVTTTLTLRKPSLLTSVGHAGVQADGQGRILGVTPQPATPVAPDVGQ